MHFHVLGGYLFLACSFSCVAALPIVPGVGYVGRTVDASTMELRATQAFSFNDTNGNVETTTKDVIAPPCDPNGGCGPKCYVDPLSGLRYFVPYGVCLTNLDSSVTTNGTQIFQTLDSFIDYYQKTLDSSDLFGSSSSTVHDFVARRQVSSMYLSWAWRSVLYYRLQATNWSPNLLAVSPDLSRALASLPLEYTPETKQEFLNFLRTMGTHYIASADMGGMQKVMTWFHECFYLMYGRRFVEEESSWSLGIIGGGSGTSKYGARNDSLWWLFSSSSSLYYGGEQFMFAPNQTQLWLRTVKANPAPVQYQLRPIHSLALNKKTQASLGAEVEDYLSDQAKLVAQRAEQLFPTQHTNTPVVPRSYAAVSLVVIGYVLSYLIDHQHEAGVKLSLNW